MFLFTRNPYTSLVHVSPDGSTLIATVPSRIGLVLFIRPDLVFIEQGVQNQAAPSWADHGRMLAAVHGQGADRCIIRFRQGGEQEGIRLLAATIQSLAPTPSRVRRRRSRFRQSRCSFWMDAMLQMVLDFLFGCRHGHLTRPFTIRGSSDTYVVCLDCATHLSYDLVLMRLRPRRWFHDDLGPCQNATPMERERTASIFSLAAICVSFLVRHLLLIERLLQNVRGLLVTHLLRPCAHAAVTRNFVVLHFLGPSDNTRVAHVRIFVVAYDVQLLPWNISPEPLNCYMPAMSPASVRPYRQPPL